MKQAVYRHWLVAGTLLASLAAAEGCVGIIGGDEPLGAPANEAQSCGGEVVPVEAVPLRRLTAAQYTNTLRDLLGDSDLVLDLEDEPGVITERAVRQLSDAAELALSRRAMWTTEVFPCELSGEGDHECVDTFIETFGARAFRRPLDEADRSWLAGVFEKVRAEASFEESMGVLLQLMLQVPATVYMFEVGEGESIEGEMRALDDWEMASRLSYFLWNTMPDEALFEAAARGELTTRAGLRAQAERLLDSPRAEENVQRFFAHWLQLDGGRLHHALEDTDKDPTLYPEYDAELRSAMRTETEAFIRRTFFEEGASIEQLFAGNYAYVNAPLAQLYGVEGPQEGWGWVTLAASERAGLLTRAAFNTVFSTKNVTAPIRRGVWVLEEALCSQLGEPPPNVNDTPVEGGEVENENGEVEVRTVREDVAARTSGNGCTGCHSAINPIGYTFEHYDAIGRYQSEEVTSGLPVDASGELKGSDVDGPLADAVELSERLAASETVRSCFATRWAKSAFGGDDFGLDSCSNQQIEQAFIETGDMRELLLAIIESNAFRFIDIDQETP